MCLYGSHGSDGLLGMLKGVYRVRWDESATLNGQTREDRNWLWLIPCKYGHIYPWGNGWLAAYCDHPRMIGRLCGIGGVRLHQLGDHECTVVFKFALVDQIGTLLRARRRPTRSPAQQAASYAALAKMRPKEGVSVVHCEAIREVDVSDTSDGPESL
jgi:hypothetical protein